MSRSGGLVGSVIGHNGSVGIGDQLSIGLSLSLLAAVVAVAGIRIAVAEAPCGQMGGCGSQVGSVIGHNGSVGVGHQLSADRAGQPTEDLKMDENHMTSHTNTLYKSIKFIDFSRFAIFFFLKHCLFV